MTQTRQRLLALGLLFAAVILVWFVVVAPVVDVFVAQSEEIASLQSQLTLFKSRIAMKPAVEMRLAELRKHEASSTGLIGGTSAELAAASMQNMVKALVESGSGQIRSAQNLPPEAADGFQRIEIQYDASVPMTRLKDIAYRIETSTPYLFLDSIDLRAPENWQSGLQNDPPPLDVRWTVRGYRWTEPQ